MGFVPGTINEVEEAVDEILKERLDFVIERGMSAMGPLMGLVMQRLGGSADGKVVSKILREKIDSITKS